MFTESFTDALIEHWTKLFCIDYYTKIKQAKEPQLYFSLLNFIKFHMWENIFMLIMQGGLALQHIQTWQRNHKGMQNHVVSKNKNELKNEGLLF